MTAPKLVLTVTYDEEKGGYQSSIEMGDGLPIAKPEPWMLEILIVSEDRLRLTRRKVESWVLKDYAETASRLRKAQSALAAQVPDLPTKES